MFRLDIFYLDEYPEIAFSKTYKTKEKAEKTARTKIDSDERIGYEIQEVNT